MIEVTTNNKELKKFEGIYLNNVCVEDMVEEDKALYTWGYDFTMEENTSIMRVCRLERIDGSITEVFSDTLILKGDEEF